MKVLKVEGHPNLVRDIKSKAILTTDTNSLNAYRTSRQRQLKIDSIVEQFDTLKNDIAEIKRLLLNKE